jgi:hypothetical protein
MSIKAYNRGSQAIANQMRQNDRPVEFEIMDNLNAIPKRNDARWIMQTAKIIRGNSGFWITGSSPVSFGFWHKRLRDLMASWRITVTGYDATKQEWTVEPTEPTTTTALRVPEIKFMA